MITGVLSNAERHAQMALALERFPLIKKHPKFNSRRMSLVCYGPSLLDTWRSIEHPIMTVSGAHDFLVERGIIPDFHVDCDPREHKAAMLRQPTNATKYLMASCCHPNFWNTLKNKRVKLWHLINGNDLETVAWVADKNPEGYGAMLGGGSTVGMRAMEVAAHIGFRRFAVHGMDCSHTEARHAGEHFGKRQLEEMVSVNGRKFKTTPQMLQAAREMEEFIQTKDADLEFYGDGLMQEAAKALKLRKAA